MDTVVSDIDHYLAELNTPQRQALQHIRDLVHGLASEAVETISYGMPAFMYRRKPLVYFAAFKDHLSLFPTSIPLDTFQEQLAGYKTSRGTIQFTLDHPLPDELVKDIIACRAGQIDEAAA